MSDVCYGQHTSAYVSIRQHTSHIPRGLAGSEDFRGHIHHSRRSPRLICCLSTSLARSFRPSRKRLLVLDRLSEVLHHVLALAGIRKVRHLAVALASAYVSICQHTSAYVSTRHMRGYATTSKTLLLHRFLCTFACIASLRAFVL